MSVVLRYPLGAVAEAGEEEGARSGDGAMKGAGIKDLVDSGGGEGRGEKVESEGGGLQEGKQRADGADGVREEGWVGRGNGGRRDGGEDCEWFGRRA